MVHLESMKLMPSPPPWPSSFNHQQQCTANSITSSMSFTTIFADGDLVSNF